ncbi:MAG: hypothetical protein ABL961_14425 [Vicinamibacterales bacterium]
MPALKRVVFRIAAGPKVGYGHLMRARALARCLDMDVVISLRGGRAAHAAAETIAPLVDESSALEGADLLVVDDPSLVAGRRWIDRARRAGIQSVSVHDDHCVHDADLVVCGALGVRRPRTDARLLHGPRFYLLEGRIAGARHLRLSKRDLSHPQILIALGGGQHVVGVAQRLVDAILKTAPTAEIMVAAGFSRGPRPRLSHARWLTVRSGLTRALLDADVAMVAGGVTLYEACALGVPAVALAVVPEQRRAILAFAQAGAVLDAGAVSSGGRAMAAAADGVARLLKNSVLRTAMTTRSRRLVDGRGAFRVAESIHALVQERSRRCA